MDIATKTICECLPGYFDDGINLICQKCNITCETCVAADTCKTCFDENLRQLVGDQCECKIGFFDTKLKVCEKCHINCYKCEGPLETDCTACFPYR